MEFQYSYGDLSFLFNYQLMVLLLLGSKVEEQARGPARLLGSLSDFILTYEDKEGDWMLVGDVPWE